MAYAQAFHSLQILPVYASQIHRIVYQRPCLGGVGSPHSRLCCHLYVPRGLTYSVTLVR